MFAKEDRTKILRFLIVGGFNTLVNYLFYLLLVFWGMHYNLALAIDYIFGTCLGYFLNRFWTFASHQNTQLSFLKYCSTYIVLFFANLLLLNILIQYLGMEPMLGQLFAFSCVVASSFLIQNFWVFKSKTPTGQ